MSAEPQSPQIIRHSAWKVGSNPIFLRYCRSRLRPRGAGIALLITFLLAAFAVALSTSIGVRIGMTPSDAVRPAAIALLGIQCVILFVIGTAQVAGGMTAERDEGVIDYQRLIPMSPLAKVMGYLFGLPIREYAMVLITLPFTAWCLWRGEVALRDWGPPYIILFVTGLLYHFTGLVTGTVVRNRRWAFLTTIALVFSLYTVIPQLANFGLVFFKYLTITPVVTECLPGLLPESAGAVARTASRLAPTVKFFGLDFSEAVFTAFSQCGLILTFVIMLCRKWQRSESHLLGKTWATGFFVWIQVLLLGNALPLIDVGTLFPSRGFSRMVRILPDWKPEPSEAVLMSGVYGIMTLALLFMLATIITPTGDNQLRGLRRARKQGTSSLPMTADAATSFGFVVTMALAGAGGWFYFTRELVESRWFPGAELPLSTLAFFIAVMVSGGISFQALLEARGGRAVGLAAIFIGVVPIMVGAVLSVISDRLMPIASWLIGISPISMPFYAATALIPISETPLEASRAIPRAFYFWLMVGCIAGSWLVVQLFVKRRAMASLVFGDRDESTSS
jgi:hypothetical protein